MREYLPRLLTGRATRSRLVADGKAALAAALADPPDLVLSDVMMPGLDGMGLLTALRADERTARVPVVLLSARAGQEAAVEGLAAGADDYLVKPFSARELMARVGAHVELGRVRRESEERFRAMADLAPALIWVADAAGARVFLNAGWQEFTGHGSADDLGDRWQTALHPEDRDRYLEVAAPPRAAVRGRSSTGCAAPTARSTGCSSGPSPSGPTTRHAGYVGSCTDINARYRESQRQSLLAAVGATLDRETEIPGQLNGLARLDGRRRLADLCTVRWSATTAAARRAGPPGPTPTPRRSWPRLTPDAADGPRGRETGRPRPDADVPARRTAGTAAAGRRRDRVDRRRRALPAGGAALRVRGRVLAVLGLGRRATPRRTTTTTGCCSRRSPPARRSRSTTRCCWSTSGRAPRGWPSSSAPRPSCPPPPRPGWSPPPCAHLARPARRGQRVGVYELDEHQAHARRPDADRRGRRRSRGPVEQRPAVGRPAPRRRPLGWTRRDPVGRAPSGWAASRRLRTGGGVALPLVAGGRPVGVIGISLRRARRVNATERATLLALAEQCAQALDRARLYRAERQIAETLQRSLLPQQLPRLDRLALAARYLPGAEGTQAGGDWYDVVELDENRVAIAVGDVVGQGAAAAAVMGQLRSALPTALLSGRARPRRWSCSTGSRPACPGRPRPPRPA